MNIFQRLGAFRWRHDPIKHVVVLMFENHSLDQMLGSLTTVYPRLDGIDPANPRHNLDSMGRIYRQTESRETAVDPDPKHELDHVHYQLDGNNSGFVLDYERSYPLTTADERQKIMSYYPRGFLPALHQLAENFTVCDQWFSSVPGPTWTNRLFLHSGTSMGLVSMPESIRDTHLFMRYTQDTIFDRLNEHRIFWRIYYGDVPQSLVLRHQKRPRNAIRYCKMRSFYADAQESEAAFPHYAFIEPHYLKGEQNDDHPPHSTLRAQRLLANVYNALRANSELCLSMEPAAFLHGTG